MNPYTVTLGLPEVCTSIRIEVNLDAFDREDAVETALDGAVDQYPAFNREDWKIISVERGGTA